MLADSRLTAFLASSNLARSRRFYEQTLGLPVLSETAIACVFECGQATLRVTRVHDPVIAPYTVLGWAAADLADTVARLTDRGVRFLRYSGLEQNEHGLWRAPAGALVAWFSDPEGHVLSLTQHG